MAIIKKTKAAIKKAESEAKLTLIAAVQPAAMASNALIKSGGGFRRGDHRNPPTTGAQVERAFRAQRIAETFRTR